MKVEVVKLPSGKDGTIELSESVFGLEPRKDILHRVVRWQLAKKTTRHSQCFDEIRK